MEFEIKYIQGWDVYFAKFDNSIKIRILKALERLKFKSTTKHLEYELPFFVEEVGKYRIAFKHDSASNVKEVYFVGDHKQYDKWTHSQ